MKRLAIFVLLSSSMASGQTEIIQTVAGNGTQGFSGDGGSATSASLFLPDLNVSFAATGVVVDASGDLFIVDTGNARIREISASGIITTVAGNGCCGYSGDGQQATTAALTYPQGVAVDASGNIYIADTGNNVIRKVSAGGVITTIAGRFGTVGFYGDGGPAAAALLYAPAGVAVDGSGNLFIADTVNNVIRKVTASSGNISTVAGNSTQGFAGDGAAATSAELYLPTGVVVDASGNLFIADRGNNRIRKVSTTGTITTIAGNGTGVSSGDGGAATAAGLASPTSIALDASGNILIAVPLNSRIREISAGGTITTVAGDGVAGFYGDGGLPTNALLNHPAGVAVDASGNIFIADTGNNRIREVSASTAPPPSINSGGIVAVDSTVTTIQPGEFVSIYGTNLGPASPATWTGVFVTSLGGTSVMIDGNPAYLTYAGPTQINAQAPNDTNTTPHTVTVAVTTTGGGTTTSTVTLAQFAPSFLLFDSKHVTGIIVRTDGSGSQGGGTYDLLGPTGNSLGFPTVAAKAGDTVQLYSVGLGPTNPPVPAGQPFSSSAQTTNPVNLLINNISVPPTFAGIDSSLLYQINLAVPAGLGTGDVPLSAMVGGAQTQSGVVISLQ
jgi:uncharacterized protein (TIGR03437 family)